jgi:hypothetical protein
VKQIGACCSTWPETCPLRSEGHENEASFLRIEINFRQPQGERGYAVYPSLPSDIALVRCSSLSPRDCVTDPQMGPIRFSISVHTPVDFSLLQVTQSESGPLLYSVRNWVVERVRLFLVVNINPHEPIPRPTEVHRRGYADIPQPSQREPEQDQAC